MVNRQLKEWPFRLAPRETGSAVTGLPFDPSCDQGVSGKQFVYAPLEQAVTNRNPVYRGSNGRRVPDPAKSRSGVLERDGSICGLEVSGWPRAEGSSCQPILFYRVHC